jgi:4-hydroxy-tetrahydrodipicolinate synthase
MMKHFGRLLTAMVTPFDSDGNVDYAQAGKLATALINSGNDGVVVCGTTGESPTVQRDEKLRLFAEIKTALGNKGTIVAGTGSYNTAESCELSGEAEKIGVDACLLVVPYYNRPTQEGLYQHFKAIAESTSLPCILYNVPSRTVTSCTAETVIKLSKIDNIIGIKEASANYEQIAQIIENTPQDFLVYSGNDGDTFPIVSMGGYGVVGVITHLVGLQVKEMIQHIIDKKINEAATIHRKLLPLVNALFVVANPMPIKYALNHLGFPVGKPRLPLIEPDEKSKAFIEETLKRFKIDLPVNK